MRAKLFTLLALLTAVSTVTFAQRSVLRYPVNFSNSPFKKGTHAVHFLQDKASGFFSLVLKSVEDEEVTYLLLDKNINPEDTLHFDSLDKTIFSKREKEYLGGTASGNVFHFIYMDGDGDDRKRPQALIMETVDFNNHTLKHRMLASISSDETVELSFGSNGYYYTVTADDDSRKLKFYQVDPHGNFSRHDVSIDLKKAAFAPKKAKLSDYFSGLTLATASEDARLEATSQMAKLYNYPDSICLVINYESTPVQIYTIHKPGFQLSSRQVDLSELAGEKKDGSYFLCSMFYNDKLISLMSTKKTTVVGICNTDGSVIKKYEINVKTPSSFFSAPPVQETRLGKRVRRKNLSARQLLKNMYKYSEGVAVSPNKKGQLVLTAGTFDPLEVHGGGTTMGGFTPMSVPSGGYYAGSNVPVMHTIYTFDPFKYTLPGRPAYLLPRANYYLSTNFKLVLDPQTFEKVKGTPSPSVSEQVREYLAEKPREDLIQFALNDRQYYGYYDKGSKSYVIQEINIRK